MVDCTADLSACPSFVLSVGEAGLEDPLQEVSGTKSEARPTPDFEDPDSEALQQHESDSGLSDLEREANTSQISKEQKVNVLQIIMLILSVLIMVNLSIF